MIKKGISFDLFLFLNACENAQRFSCKTVRFSVFANRKGCDGRSLGRAREQHEKGAVAPVFQRRGIFRGTPLDFERVAIR